MEVHSLKLTITEDDLNALIRRHAPKDLPIEDLRLHIRTDGIYLKGMYPLFIDVNFEAIWELGVSNGVVGARLAQLKALGIPANIFRSAILKLLEEAVRKEASLSLKEDTIFVDFHSLLAREGLHCRLHLRALSLQLGVIEVEAGRDL